MARTNRVLPGFGLSLGFTLAYLSLIVLIPLSAVFIKTATMDFERFWSVVTSDRVVASYKLSFGMSLLAAADQRRVWPAAGLGHRALLISRARRSSMRWSIFRSRLPTAVAGIALTALYAPNGWLGQILEPLGIKIAFGPLGVLVALIFIGLPFVVRTVQPILEDLEAEFEEAAASLGASRWQTVRRVVFPALLPALADRVRAWPSRAPSVSTAP